MEPQKISEFLKAYRKEKGLTQAEMAASIGVSPRAYQDYENTGIVKKADILIKIQSILGIDEYDLLNNNMQNIAEYKNAKNFRKPKIEDNPETEGIIYVPISAQAGYTLHHLNPTFVSSLQKIFIPGMPYRGPRFRIFEVDGESMEPTLKQGYHVLTEIVQPEFYHQVANYYIYVVVTEDRIMIKRLFFRNDEFVAISDNEDFFPQFVLKLQEVKELWVVKRKLDWEMSPPKKFEIKV